MKVLLRLLAYLRFHKRALAIAYVGLFGSIAFSSATPLVLKMAIDRGIGGGSEVALVYAGVALVLFAAGKGLFAYVQSYMGEYLSQKIAFDLRRDFYDRVQSLSFKFHDQMETGQLMSRATVDVDTSRQFLSMGALRIVYTFGLVTVVVSIMVALNWKIALLVLASIPLTAFVSVVMARRTRPLWLAVQQNIGVETSVLQESITGIRVLKAFNQEDQQYGRFTDANWAVRERSLDANRIAAFNQPFMLFILNAITVVILLYGGSLAIGGALTIGTLVAFIEYRSQLAAPIRTFGMLVNLATRASSSGERIFEIIDALSDVQEAPDARPLEHVEGRVRFEDVSFAYTSSAPVVEHIDIDALPGQTVALLGPTGSGKTTLTNLLPRFYDVMSGRISIDGVDVRDVQLESLRRAVGVVLQDTFLFSATIRDNIGYGKPGATQREIEQAAKTAQIHDFITSLPDGYDTWVGERGVTLSGGQKQRVAIARMLLLDPRVLVLDDSTSAVDMETEFLIQEALLHLVKGRTSFVIAHRLRTIKQADQILVMERGHIVQRGTHEELVHQPGPYREIYHLQLREQEEPSGSGADAAAEVMPS